MTKNCLHLTSICGFIVIILGLGITNVNANQCGTSALPRLLKRETGTETWRGEFPFLAALYLVEGKRLLCGESLISSKHILTAANCVEGNAKKLLPRDYLVLLGAHDLTSTYEGEINRNVTKIHVHPDWDVNTQTYDANLAILVLSEIVSFTSYIRLVCMPPVDFVIAGSKGLIVGWDEMESQLHFTFPKQVVTNALNNTDCFTTDYFIAAISSLRTFCGRGEVISLGRGDSGNGFFVRHGAAWIQIGILSATRFNRSGQIAADAISVYTNVNEFKTWKIDTVKQSGGEIGELQQEST